MIFSETRLPGAYLIEPQLIQDERGFFGRTWCAETFIAQGLNPELAQCNLSFNHRKGTLRGLHYQIVPYAEAKLVRCTMGAIFDVAVDLRPDSRSYLKWFGAELSAENRLMLYVPEGVAHGFQTLRDCTEVFYQMSQPYEPLAARGLCWNDEILQINWPLAVSEISEKDCSYGRLSAALRLDDCPEDGKTAERCAV